jgi:hypothetical protein
MKKYFMFLLAMLMYAPYLVYFFIKGGIAEAGEFIQDNRGLWKEVKKKEGE